MNTEQPGLPNFAQPEAPPVMVPSARSSVTEVSTLDLLRPCPTDEDLAKWEALGRFVGRALSTTVAGEPRVEGRTIGRFQVLRILGRGGNGTVYQALDPLIGRDVAIKVPHPFVIPSDDSRGRFLQEAKILSELVHTNIVAIFDVGHDRDWPFLVFEYCPGGSLADWLARQVEQLSPTTCARIVRTLALAAHYAHARGILHRDVNPRNVLLVPLPDGEAAADGGAFPFVAKLSDFGLGTWLDEQKSAVQTQTDAVMGTLHYMAPEQTQGGKLPLQATTDVYALGVILFEMLTGRRPFVGATHVETIQMIRDGEPPRLCQFRAKVPRDLETICLRCLEKLPERRYATAADLAADLERFLSGNAIHARPVGVVEKTVRWLSKRRSQVSIVALILVLLATIGAGSVWYANKLHDARIAEQKLKQQTKDQNSKLLHAKATDQRMQSILRGNYLRQIAAIAERVQSPPFPAYELVQQLRQWIPKTAADPDVRGFDWYFLMHACGGDIAPLATLTKPTFEIQAMHVAEAGDSVFIAEGNVLTEWDVDTGRQRRIVYDEGRDIRDFAVSQRNNLLAIARFGKRDVHLLRLTSSKARHLKFTEENGPLGPKQFNRVFYNRDDSELIAIYSKDASFRPHSRTIFHPTDLEKPPSTGYCHNGFYYDIVIDPNTGDLISTADHGIHVAFQDQDLHLTIPLKTDLPCATSLAISRDSQLLAVGTERNDILLCRKDQAGTWKQAESLNVTSRELPVTPHIYLHPRNRLRFGRDNQTLFISHDRELQVWDVARRKRLHSVSGLPETLRYLEILPDGQTAVWSTETVLGLWCPPTVRPDIKGHDKEAWSVAFSPNGRLLATGSDDETVRIWDLSTGTKLDELKGHIATVTKVAFSPKGELLASGSLDGTVRIWGAKTRQLVRILNDHSGPVRDLAWFADGRRLAVSDSPEPGLPPHIVIWDATTGKVLHSLAGFEDRIHAVIVTRDQRHVIGGSNDKSIRMWNTDSGTLEQTWSGDSQIGSAVLLNADRWLATGDNSGVIQIRDIQNGGPLHELRGHTDRVLALAESPDGRCLVSAGVDASIRLWDVETGASLIVFKDQAAQINGLAFSPSGEILAAALHDGSIKYLHAPRFKPIQFDR